MPVYMPPTAASVPGARVYNSANISAADAGDTALTFDSERYDTDGIHSTSSNTGRLTCQTAGKYMISFTGYFAYAAGGGSRGFAIRLNGTTGIAIVRNSAVINVGDVTAFTLSTIYDLAVSDYVEVTAYQISGAALNVISSGNNTPEFMMQYVGPA